MRQKWPRSIILIFIGLFLVFTGFVLPAKASVHPQQQPTSSVPTVTGTPVGVIITVKMDQDQINVRSGPGTIYPKVGVLLAGQQVPAKGRTANGEWILVEYPGAPGGQAWVYAPLVDPAGGSLPVTEPPPTPTPLYTATIDPTLAAQFVITTVPTLQPTFTPPPPLVIPTFVDASGSAAPGGLPMGLIIVALGALGIFLGIFAIIQGR